MNPLSKAVVPVASEASHKFPLHRGHITTSSFMRFDCATARELAPNSHFKGNHQTVIRTMPLKRPLFGNVMVHSSAYFVPFRTVWDLFTSMIEDSPVNTDNGTIIPSQTPYIENATIWKLLKGSRFSTLTWTDNTSSPAYSSTFDPINDPYDFRIYNGNYEECYTFTSLGRYVWSTLVQLGYRFNPSSSAISEPSSALPLLCLVKVYLDWYFPNAYAHYGDYASVDGILNRRFIYALSDSDIEKIFDVMHYVSYNSDYFVNAFDNPAGPNDYTGSVNFRIVDITNNAISGNVSSAQVVTNDFSIAGPSNADVKPNNGTPFIGNNMALAAKSAAGVTTDYVLQSLHALTDYCKRHQLAGSRSLERYLLDWGLALDADKIRRSIRLVSRKYPMQVSDVMSTGDSYNPNSNIGSVLGDYAGKSIGYDGSLDVDFETSEFGYFIIITTFVPDASYVQGYDKFTKHLTKLDFLTGEFDGLGTQPIERGELFVGMKRPVSINEIFGFIPRYAEYKTVKDVLSGDFLFGSLNKGLLGWETNRLFSDMYGDAPFAINHSLDFMLGSDGSQFNRLFIDDEDDSDKFIVVHRDNIALLQPSKPLYDMFDFEDMEKHRKVSIEANGVKEN